MARSVELRRHTDSDGDVLSQEGVSAAVEVGRTLRGGYDVVVSSGAQRATQTIACFLAGLGERVDSGVTVDVRFRSANEDRWRSAYEEAGSGDIESFRKVDPDLVAEESRLLGEALGGIFEMLPEGGSALVVGHSPMQEAAVYGLTGEMVEPISKGGGVIVAEDGDRYRVEVLD
jgi:broad specificity phosphatase PhoE